MSSARQTVTRAARIRAGLDHPVIDADGHWIETAPVLQAYLRDYVKRFGGEQLAARFEASAGLDYDDTVLRPWSALSAEQRRASWATRPPWWSLPAQNTLDRATAHLPALMAERLDELGIDFAVLYPSRTLTTTAIKEDEVRRVACRALNAYHHELYAPHADRLTPVAQIPMHTPDEAIAELDHAVGELGMKAIMINGLIHRPVMGAREAAGGAGAAGAEGAADGAVGRRLPNWGSGSGERLDTFGIDSEYDYDPVWARCVELGVAPASHAPGMGWGSRRSPSSYMYNHIGSFAASMEALCKSLFMGGVTRRFPTLGFGLLEGGVGWACILYADILSHWEKRNRDTIRALDPARIDGELLVELFTEYGQGLLKTDPARVRESIARLEPEPPLLDEWAACGVASADDIRDAFVPRFYFGCEADDPTVAWAFNERLNPGGAKLRAMFSSDMGHWDVPDMREILPEAWELVEHGHIGEDDFRDFVFTNPVRFYTSANPDFFRGTRVEAQAAKLVAEQA